MNWVESRKGCGWKAKVFRQLRDVCDVLVSARVESISWPLPWRRASQTAIASGGYYSSTHLYDANIYRTIGQRSIKFAHRSLRLLDVETVHCAVSQRSKVIPAATVRRGVSECTSDFQTWRHSDIFYPFS